MTIPSDFDARGLELLGLFQKFRATGDDSKEISDPVRQWLDEASIYKQTKTSYIWGGLMQVLLEQHSPNDRLYQSFDHFFALIKNPSPQEEARKQQHLNKRENDKQRLLADRDRLLVYLEAMAEISKEDFFALGHYEPMRVSWRDTGYQQRPNCDALNVVLERLVGSPQDSLMPMTRALLGSDAWDPSALLARLQSWSADQLSYVQETVSDPTNTSAHKTPQGRLLAVLASAVLHSDWRPQDNVSCRELWAFADPELLVKPEGLPLLKGLWSSMPNQRDAGLHTLIDCQGLSGEHLDVFFPLPLDTPDNRGILRSLAQSFYLCREGAKFMRGPEIEQSLQVESRVREHHPELFNLLDMHLSFFPYDAATEENLTILVNSFDNWRGNRNSLNAAESLSLPSDF